MIEISRAYNAKTEFKLIYKTLRFLSNNFRIKYDIKNTLETQYKCTIDIFTDRWKRQNVTKDTYNKLHRFAIAYRHNAINNGIH